MTPKDIIVHLDNGHGTSTSYYSISANGKRRASKCSPDGSLIEMNYNREIEKMLEKKLAEAGFGVYNVVPEQTEPGLLNRCSRSNSVYEKNPNKKHIFVSIHCNAAGSGGEWRDARGWGVFVGTSASANSKKLADKMFEAAVEAKVKVRRPSKTQNYHVKELTVCNKTKIPAVLVENFFMDNKEDCQYLLSAEGKKTVVEIMFNGIKKYFGIS